LPIAAERSSATRWWSRDSLPVRSKARRSKSRLLGSNDQTLEQLATEVGYRDAFAFSKAFKRALGVSPGEYRRRSALDAKAHFRFTANEAVGTP
jgi:AraC-like DNA-binding protein